MHRFASASAIAAVCTIGLASSARANLFATEWRSTTGTVSLYDVNTGTRAVTRVGAAGATTSPRFIGLVAASDGTLYGVSEEPSSRLFSINPATGVGTPIGATGLNLQEGDLAISPTGQIYLAQASGDQLYTINRTTGAATIVGAFGTAGRDMSGMLFVGSTLYGLALNDSAADQLVTINPATGAATNIGPTGTNFSVIAAMGLDPTNSTVFIAGPTTSFSNDNTLHSVNLASGVATLRGTLPGLDFSVSGFAPNVPEPATMGLVAVGAIAFARRRR